MICDMGGGGCEGGACCLHMTSFALYEVDDVVQWVVSVWSDSRIHKMELCIYFVG